MFIDLDWTTVITADSSLVLDRNHLASMSRASLRRAADRVASFLDAVLATDTEIDWNDGRVELFLSATGDQEPEDIGQSAGWGDSFVEANDPSDDTEWQVESLLALLADLGRIGRLGVEGIDLKAGTCTPSDKTVINMAGWDPLVEQVNTYLDLLDNASAFRTGFVTIRSEHRVLQLDAEHVRDITCGTAIALGLVTLRCMSACLTNG
ncbi:hypothetical protein [Bifidobacterium samirii]|uniref:Uncharacterized protein n=1 Tax=Bifidobacterium samirii TaxID=2306974 RepID=A0A430FJA1_9BIFI|nr:hypothetical protein [Bifidobacterium samirii]RSX52964.1 hypothetical protein D2E24_1733 [Bifidobacterium samirii]